MVVHFHTLVFSWHPIVEPYIAHLLCKLLELQISDIILNGLCCLCISSLATWQQNDPALLISDISEELIKDEITMETAIAERVKAGKKRGKKIKQRVSTR